MNNPLTSFILTIVLALISGWGAYLSQRAASKASVTNTKITAEAEAYDRARNMDIKTIDRQDKDIEELQKENQTLRIEVRQLREDNARLHAENADLRRRLGRLEETIGGTNG